VRISKRIIESANPLVLLLSLSGLVCACVTPAPRPEFLTAPTANVEHERVRVPAQRVTSHLKEQFEGLAPNQFVPGIIRLSEKPDLRTVSEVIEAEDNGRRRAAVISHLRQHSLSTQSRILDSLSELATAGLALDISINPDATQIKNIIYTEK